jgi:pyridoxamine 5'-phosphate oxidase
MQNEGDKRNGMSDTGKPVEEGIQAVRDPFELFAAWLKDAEKTEPNDPNAMAVATVDGDGCPDVRMLLLKAHDPRGFVFYTNLESAKGRQLEARPFAALDFHWKTLRKQIRIRGPVSAVSAAEADAYFASRAKDSQIGAWASAQSRAMEGRWVFEKEIAKFALKYGLTKVPRPPYWSGYRVTPLQIEFWRDRPFRLHDRLVYRRADENAPWRTERLYP